MTVRSIVLKAAELTAACFIVSAFVVALEWVPIAIAIRRQK